MLKALFFLLAFFLLGSDAQAVGITRYQPLNTASFWQGVAGGGEELVLAGDKIRSFNRELAAAGLGARDLSDSPESSSAGDLAKLLGRKLPLLNKNLYVKGRPISADYKEILRNELNIAALAAKNPADYGVTVVRANLRELPTNDILSLPEGADQLQVMALNPSEPVVILWQSRNKAFYFVQTRYGEGWLPVWTVGKTDREIWLTYARMEDFLVVTASQLSLLAGREEKLYQMGARILVQEASGSPPSSYTVFLPKRDKDGYLAEDTLVLPKSDNYQYGFLPYTRHNILRQAFRLLNAPYGRDAMAGNVDGATFVANVYQTVGLELPHDLAGLESVPGGRIALKGLDADRKKAVLGVLKPGDLIFLPGQVLLYLGKTQEMPYVLHALDRYYADGRPVNVRQVVVSDLLLGAPGGQTYFDLLASVLSLR